MKKLIKSLFHSVGLEVTRYRKPVPAQSKRTRALSYIETVTGNYYLPTDATEDVIADAIRNNRVFEPEVVALAAQFIREGDVVLDVGSNFGQMAVQFARKAGATGRVHCFEADDWVFEILRKNIETNNLKDRIIPHFGAVHNADGQTLFFPEQDFVESGTYGSYGIDYTASKGRAVPTLTIDSLDIPGRISFMKVDIQGGDLQAMQGAVKTIAKYRMPILFEYEYHLEEKFALCFQDYVDFVQQIGYSFSRVVNGHNYLIVPKEFKHDNG